MRTWYTADLHLGHVAISAYTNRPYVAVGEMNEAIVANFSDHIRPEDTLVVLGDVAMGQIAETLPLVGKLPGRKLLVPGNHDRCWIGHGEKARAWRERYLEAGFDDILDAPDSIELAGVMVQRSHFPYQGAGDHTEVERYSDHRPLDDGDWLLCGHVHTQWRQNGRMINVGVDAWGGRPVSLEELEDLVRKGPTEHPVISWTDRTG